jgi:hypothetical protein
MNDHDPTAGYRVQRADGPGDRRGRGAAVEEHRQSGARLRCARRRHERDHGVAPGDDTAAMIDCLQRLGAGIGVRVEGEHHVADVRGTGAALTPGPLRLEPGSPGTTSRFVTALCTLGVGEYTVDGAPPLRARPMGPLHDSLGALGASVTPGETVGHLPVTVAGPLRRADAVVMPGDVSSQYVTALMLIAPYIPGGLKLWLSSGSGLTAVPRDHPLGDGGVRGHRCRSEGSPRHRRAGGVPAHRVRRRTRRQLGELPARRRRHGRWCGERAGARQLARCRETPVSSRSSPRWAASSPPVPPTPW